MCGRFTITKKSEEVEEFFDIEVDRNEYAVHYNGAPTQKFAVITNEQPKKASFFQWGLIPFWAKDPAIGNKLINARAETINEKPSFSRSLKTKRCLVIADGFYEWEADGPNKIPWRIALKDDGLFAFAGLWDQWKTPEGSPLFTFTIITTAPNALMQSIHSRMPVILKKEDNAAWLQSTTTAGALELLKPYPAELMHCHPVSRAVNSPMNDSPEVMRPK